MIQKRILTCKKCGGKSFMFRWEYPQEKEIHLYLAHDGIGFQLIDSIVTCSRCKSESEYESEDFLEAKK